MRDDVGSTNGEAADPEVSDETTSSEGARTGLSRRSALAAIGLTGLLGIGATTASADPQGQVGTTDDPVRQLHTEEIRSSSGLRIVTGGDAAEAGNIVAGHPDNSVGSDVEGATISGGGEVTGTDDWSNEVTGGFGTIGGGRENTVSGFASTIAGGRSHTVSGTSATVGGGFNNSIEADDSVIAGGDSNEVYGDHCAIGGGEFNQAGHDSVNAHNATVPGGGDNIADAHYSFAAGREAKVNGNIGAFVWGDSSLEEVSAAAANQFVVQAEGGVYLGTGTGPTGDFHDDGKFIDTSTGAHLTTGGTWTDSSSRTVKENVDPVDTDSVLKRVESLPVSEWNYEDEPDDVRHLGPMAEDFYDAFELGADDEHIASLDTAGVALAAIQGLAERNEDAVERIDATTEHVEETDERIEELEATNEALRSELDEVRAELEFVQNAVVAADGGDEE